MVKDYDYFDPVDTKIIFPEAEKKLLNRWYKEGIVQKYLNKNKTSKKYYSFLDGPITANNPMGVHHAWGRTYKDLWQRYYNMRGFKQRFQNGFDCQGLWVEVEVEKELGLKNKKDIENLVPGDKKASIDKFVQLCKERVYKYASTQTEQSKRLGYFMDWENSYFTLSEDNNYMIWHFLKKCHEKGLIYKGRDSVPWCPRCGTAISQHEMLTEDYKEVSHESVFFALPVLNQDFSLLIWTTTPWTIPANVAVAVHPDWVYKVWENNSDGKKYLILTSGDWEGDSDPSGRTLSILTQSRPDKSGFKAIREYTGNDLVKNNFHYKGPFDEIPAVVKAKQHNTKTFHSIISAKDLVTAEEGTGLVHIAPGAGTEDFALGKEFNLSVIAPINEEAVYYEDFGFLTGKNAKKHPELIIDYLRNEKSEFFAATHNFKHRYPACWRCKTELVWRVVDEWYIAIDPVRENMKKVAKKINWIPEFGKKRELDWLDNMHDWLISKKRYWGLALPVWECKSCGNFDVIGSKEELKEKAIEGWEDFEKHSPHKPWIDQVTIKCSKCGETIERISDVGNPWLDAGIVSFSTLSSDNKGTPLYWSDKKEWEKWYPAHFITESFPGQFKNWFYSLIAMSTVLENKEPFKTVLGFATLLAEDGRPMHKSWGNAIEFNEGAEKIGVDVMRWMFLKQNPSDNLLFGYRIADETRRKFHLTLWNIYNFFVTYANVDGWKPTPARSVVINNLLDAWACARLQETVTNVNESLEKYDAQKASIFIEEFVNDLSLWYIRRSRSRVGFAAKDDSDKKDFYEFSYLILLNLSRILAPFTPFLADTIFTNLTKLSSVHLSTWPDKNQLSNLHQMIGSKRKLNELIEQMEYVRNIVEKGHSLRKEKAIPVRQPLKSITVAWDKEIDQRLAYLIKDELNVKDVVWKKGSSLKVNLDTEITAELEEEAKTRELIRKIQEERRRLAVELKQKISVKNDWLPADRKFIEQVKETTLAYKLQKGPFSVTKETSS